LIDPVTKKELILFQLPNLPPNVFVMSAKSLKSSMPMRVEYTAPSLPFVVKMNRNQYPFLPAYAITVDASQGRSLDSALVCLEGNPTYNSKDYVMLSMVRTGGALGIIGKIPAYVCRTTPNETMLEFEKDFLRPLALKTASKQRLLRINLARMEKQLATGRPLSVSCP
jgi:hypothetical protein